VTERHRSVAIVTSNFWPEPTGTSQTVTEFARYLAACGIHVQVATSMPYYPQWRVWPNYRGSLWRREEVDGMTVYRSWHFVRPNPSTAVRILHELTLSLLAVPILMRVLRSAGVAYIVSPALSYAFTGTFLAWLFGVRRVLMVKDVMPDAAVELGMMRNPVMIAVSRWLARRIYRSAQEIHTLGEGMRRRITREIPDPDKVRIVRDTIDPDELGPVPRADNEFRKRFVPPGTFAILHTGNMGKKQDLDLLLRTAERLRTEPEYHFYVFGDGAVKGSFLAKCMAAGLTNVSHFPLQDRWMLRHMLSGADVVLVSQLPEVVDIVFPSKLVTALAAGAMVVLAAAPASEAAETLLQADTGVVVPASDDAVLAETLRAIRRGSVDLERLRTRARAYAVRMFSRAAVYGPIAQEARQQLEAKG
jgi:colanic acid biosynthesis glycosyl transferase WcaI